MAQSGEQVRGRYSHGSPRARRTSPEGVFSPRARRTLPEGAFSPRARRTSPEGAFSPRARWTSPEGAAGPRARQTLPEGATGPIVLVGRGGHQGCDCVVRVLGLQIYLRLRF
jgi:hypothetical protein